MNKIFNLNNLQGEKWIEGITDGQADDYLGDIRGEFVGYYCEKDGPVKLFRDRAGARNLYYSINCPKVFVSTDILWVLKNCGYEKKLNMDYIDSQYLAFQVPFFNETIFRHIKKVMPGEIVTVLETGEVLHCRYWDVKDYLGEEKFNPLHLKNLIIDAVEWRKKIIVDNFTSYLSGGLDSSTITLIAKPGLCYSGVYEEKEYLEIDYIDAVLKSVLKSTNNMVNLRVLMVQIERDDFYNLLHRLPNIMPDPMAGLGTIPQVIVAQAATNVHGYQHAFTGEGGDELFGYPWNYAICEIAKQLHFLNDRDKYLHGWNPMLNKILKHAFVGFVATALGRGSDKKKQLETLESVWDFNESAENNLFLFNINIGLPAILTVDECVGKYCGIMPVSPFVDHHIIEYVASIDPQERWKIPKYLLREAMEGILPEKVRNRTDKMGFPIPRSYWKWSGLQGVLQSLRNREIMEVPQFDELSRQCWAYVNIEGIYRIMEEL